MGSGIQGVEHLSIEEVLDGCMQMDGMHNGL